MQENCAAPAGLRMSEGVLTVFKDILVGSNCNVYLRYWYRLLNVNSRRLNRERYEGDQMRLFKIVKKNWLSDEERKEMLRNGFSAKYIVSDHNVPFEEFRLNGLKEWALYGAYRFVVGSVLRFDLGRNWTRTIIRNAMRRTNSIRSEKIGELEKLSVKRMEFAECPFTGAIRTRDDPVFYEVFDESG